MTVEAELPLHGSERGKILKQCRNRAKKTFFILLSKSCYP
jgi:hypothetical protein